MGLLRWVINERLGAGTRPAPAHGYDWHDYGRDVINENLKLKLTTLVQVTPPSMELYDRPKIGTSFGKPVADPEPSRPISGGIALTPGNGVAVGT